ncbi:MAG: M23 family metallopeptidase [Alphaproteobacteria bacterium]
MYLYKILKSWVLMALALLAGLFLTPHMAFAQPVFGQTNCQLQNTFPSNYVYPPSHFGASRNGGARWHAGVDFFFPIGTTVSVPQGCQIRLYSDGTVIWKNDPNGYGQYMFIDCMLGNVPITLRYAHIAQYNTSQATIQQGRTGISTASIPDHYHFEVLINQSGGQGTPVDPECVLGLTKGAGPNSPIAACQGCPTPPGPVDFCNNPNAVSQLIAHSNQCYRGPAKNNPGGATVDPNQLRGVPNQGTPGTTSGPPNGAATNPYDDDVYLNTPPGGGYTGNPNTLYPPGSNTIPPINPPPPPIPGTPGGASNLVPSASNATNNDGCATDTWTAMVNQAVMETRREDILNKRFIVKADSVLDYSCFSRWYTDTGNLVGPIFSETTRWDNLPVSLIGKTVRIQLSTQDQTTPPFDVELNYQFQRTTTNSQGQSITYQLLGSNSLDVAIDTLVGSVANAYLQQNFNHSFLAGTAPVTGANPSSCNTMATVWRAAKCKNFDGTTVFYTFNDLINFDPREFPSNMPCN